GHGMWSRISGFMAGEIALFAFAGLLADALRKSSLSARARNWFGSACLAGFVFGTPLLFLLGNLSIYNEAIICAFAWPLAAHFFAIRSRSTEGRAQTVSLGAFSFCAAAALLSRVPFGAPLLLIAPILAIHIPRDNRWRQWTTLFLPLGAGLCFYLLLSYARFGTFAGISLDHYINPWHREFAHKYGMFSLRRIPYSVADYFHFRFPSLQWQAPFLRADRYFYAHPQLYSNAFSETYLPVTWTANWLLAGAIFGTICLFRRNCADLFERGAAIAFAFQAIGILSYFVLAQRYSVDLYPFLIFFFLIFLRRDRTFLLRIDPLIIRFVVFWMVIK